MDTKEQTIRKLELERNSYRRLLERIARGRFPTPARKRVRTCLFFWDSIKSGVNMNTGQRLAEK
jgi:hypothetical protein